MGVQSVKAETKDIFSETKMKSVQVMSVMLPLLMAQSPCPNDETSCILRHLLSQGLIRDKLTVSAPQGPEARANDFSADETFKENLELNNPAEVRSSRYRVRRGNYQPRGRQARGRQAPCLWETSYYMGDSGI